MSYEAIGKLHKVFPTEKKTDTFQAREFILEVPGNYLQLVKFQLVQDRCQLIDNYAEGQEITVHFDLRGREWQGKYFTNLQAWRLDPAPGQESPAPAPAPSPEPEAPAGESPEGEGDNDLPF